MQSLKNDRLIKALDRQPVDRVPVWLMRQAGRYLPEYRLLRAREKNFLTFCKTPELAAEATLLPIKRYPLDAAIIFSDILTIPEAMKLGVYFDMERGIGPRLTYPVRTEAEVEKLFVPDPEQDLGYVLEAIRLSKKALDQTIPLIGFAGSPWTLATYMIEGGSSRHFSLINKMRYARPELLHQVLSVLTESIILFLKAQVKAGVDVVMLFDTWGGILSRKDYLVFSLFYMEKIIQALKSVVPTMIFTKNGGRFLKEIAKTGCSAISIDWLGDLTKAYKILRGKTALQGNLEPSVLYAKDKEINIQVESLFKALPEKTGYIFNLGHGMTPDIEPNKVSVLLEAVHRFGRQ